MLWPTVITIPAVAVMLFLALWQLERLEWKTELIEVRQARVTAPAVSLPGPGAPADAFEYFPVRVEGSFLHDSEMYLGARSMRGNVGFQVVTPFRVAAGTGADAEAERIILVNRGWVPDTHRDPARRPEGQVAGVLTLEGTLRWPAERAWLQPENEPDKNFWFYMDLPAMAAHAGVAANTRYYVEASALPNPGGLPIGGQTRVDLPNDHLHYALTWFALAATLIVIYVLFHYRRAEELRAGRHEGGHGTSGGRRPSA
jgi:surfeit locus 1 family protein